jgi:5-methylcytosine-specific restriction endonuclease McrA
MAEMDFTEPKAATVGYEPIVHCVRCGGELPTYKGRGRRPKYCSKVCREDLGAAEERTNDKKYFPCQTCGANTGRARIEYCSLNCRPDAFCTGCGSKAGKIKKSIIHYWCSNACRLRATRPRKHTPEEWRLKIQQGEEKRAKEMADSEAEKLRRETERVAKAADKLERKQSREALLCAWCRSPVGYVFGSPRRFCGNQCRIKHAKANPTESEKRSRRIAKAKRRALERGKASERIDPLRVFERDGWKCQLCGDKLRPNRRGKYHPKSPELDHIIPLASGGTHTRDNVQCACRKCNIAKSSRPLGQRLLIGVV